MKNNTNNQNDTLYIPENIHVIARLSTLDGVETISFEGYSFLTMIPPPPTNKELLAHDLLYRGSCKPDEFYDEGDNYDHGCGRLIGQTNEAHLLEAY